MLDTVAELAQHGIGHVGRVLRHEIHAHALRADQAHHLLDLVEQGLGRIVEQQMRLVEEKHQPGLVQVAGLGHLLEQFGQHPQQEGGVQLGRIEQLVGGQDVDHAEPILGLEQIVEVEHGLAEERSAPCDSSAIRLRWIAPMDAARYCRTRW
jgi:hypothetical protein